MEIRRELEELMRKSEGVNVEISRELKELM